MKSGLPVKPFLYIAFTVAFFTVLLILDRVFGFHYEPIDHDLAKEVTEQPELVNQIQSGTFEEKIASDEKSDDSLKRSNEEANPSEKEQPETHSEPLPQEPAYVEEYFEKLLADYKTNVVANLKKNNARTDIIIRYYHHEPDGNSAYALGKLGYYIHEREVAPEYLNYQSNAIFYGDSVSLEDLQIVSYALLKEGLPIKEIVPSRFHDSWKSRAIEIGTDTTMIDRPSITLEQLRSLSL